MTGFLAPAVGREIFGRNPNAIVSGTLAAPYGRATVVEVEDVFVPTGWAFWWTDTPHHPGPLYKHRWWLLAHGAQRLGVARAAIDALYELAQVKTPSRSTTLIRDRPLTQMQFAQAEALRRSARAWLWDTATRLWERVCAGDQLSLKDLAWPAWRTPTPRSSRPRSPT